MIGVERIIAHIGQLMTCCSQSISHGSHPPNMCVRAISVVLFGWRGSRLAPCCSRQHNRTLSSQPNTCTPTLQRAPHPPSFGLEGMIDVISRCGIFRAAVILIVELTLYECLFSVCVRCKCVLRISATECLTQARHRCSPIK